MPTFEKKTPARSDVRDPIPVYTEAEHGLILHGTEVALGQSASPSGQSSWWL